MNTEIKPNKKISRVGPDGEIAPLEGQTPEEFLAETLGDFPHDETIEIDQLLAKARSELMALSYRTAVNTVNLESIVIDMIFFLVDEGHSENDDRPATRALMSILFIISKVLFYSHENLRPIILGEEAIVFLISAVIALSSRKTLPKLVESDEESEALQKAKEKNEKVKRL